MSQLDTTVPAQVLAAFDTIAVDGVKIRYYPDAYDDEVAGRKVLGPASDVDIVCSPILEYTSQYMKPDDIDDSAMGFVMLPGRNILIEPLKGQFMVGLDGDKLFSILKVKKHKTGALVAAYECHLGR